MSIVLGMVNGNGPMQVGAATANVSIRFIIFVVVVLPPSFLSRLVIFPTGLLQVLHTVFHVH